MLYSATFVDEFTHTGRWHPGKEEKVREVLRKQLILNICTAVVLNICLALSDQSGFCASGLYQSKLHQKLLHVGILNKQCRCANGQLCTTEFFQL